MTSRRGFLGIIGAAIAGATLDPERLLWEPGKKLISIPKPQMVTTGWSSLAGFRVGDMFTIQGHLLRDPATGHALLEPRTGKGMLQRYIVSGFEPAGRMLFNPSTPPYLSKGNLSSSMDLQLLVDRNSPVRRIPR